jgi:hypothetical protein
MLRMPGEGTVRVSGETDQAFQPCNGVTLFLNSRQGIRWTGATSGNTLVQASPVAGGGILTLPATVTDTLVPGQPQIR